MEMEVGERERGREGGREKVERWRWRWRCEQSRVGGVGEGVGLGVAGGARERGLNDGPTGWVGSWRERCGAN
jgi:hypothetical protein